MFHHSANLQYPVRVDKPDPQFAMLLQQAIGGVDRRNPRGDAVLLFGDGRPER
ncbi:Manganese containing catalase [Halomonas korlensis]|uniref:Manganese containing catalase n=2 Tax=Halomonas korlensis TaxID=463301 RepID=A0A1I7G9L6_9GAMM|nr:manganese catalase family protein [Halomonas korlensis]SFU44966.1 Manganese containing catalase [Halomonas korlensis]